MNARKENARPVAPTTGTGGEIKRNTPCSFSVPRSHSTAGAGKCQYKIEQYGTESDVAPVMIRCNIDNEPMSRKPTGGEYGAMRKRMETRTLDARRLCERGILQGFSFTPAALDGTGGDSWREQRLFAVDIDNHAGDESPLTVERAREKMEEKNVNPLFGYYTFSHTDAVPRFRIVFATDETVTAKEQAVKITQGLQSIFPGADSATKDPARIFLGTDKGACIPYTGLTNPAETLLRLYHEPEPEQTTVNPSAEESDLARAIEDFDMASYVAASEGLQGISRNGEMAFNPCPICGHKDDFYTKGNVWHCHSASNTTGIKGGNIINYLEARHNFTRERAREYFMYDILRWDKPKPPAPFPSTVIEDEGEKRGRGRPPKIPLSPDALRDELDRAGIKVRWNVITRRLDYEGIPEAWDLDPEAMGEDFPVKLEYELKPLYSGTRDIKRLIALIGKAKSNRYNPVLDYITAEPWDGRDYLPDFCDLLHISDDALSCSLLGNWLWQGIALLHNDTTRNYSADGILTLQGGQGVGKTTLANVLGLKPEWTVTGGRLDAGDKDTHIRMTSAFVAEFGELDGTFKRTDAARMKAFITEQTDRFRRPYGESDTAQVRRTSYIASVNEPRFLIDRTGNRRYWTVPIEKRIDCGELRRFNVLGLWRQALAEWREHDANGHGGDCYRLTDWQREKLDERNKAYLIATQAEDEVADIFAEAEAEPDNFEWRNATVSDFKSLNASLARYSVTAISKALDSLGHEMKRVKTNGKTDRMRYLPCRKFS